MNRYKRVGTVIWITIHVWNYDKVGRSWVVVLCQCSSCCSLRYRPKWNSEQRRCSMVLRRLLGVDIDNEQSRSAKR